ncbi:hypothetical protein P0D87_25780 [Paraburkholderia sp. RL17-368-BIF-A]
MLKQVESKSRTAGHIAEVTRAFSQLIYPAIWRRETNVDEQQKAAKPLPTQERT